MTCRCCIHFDVCSKGGKTQYYGRIIACNDVEERCNLFINKADVVEVRHGEWIETYNEMVCSKCHLPPLTKEVTNGTIEILTKYCPNCGAKMDGEKNV